MAKRLSKKKIVTAVHDQLGKERRKAIQNEDKILKFNFRRRNAASRFRERIFQKGMKAAGIDTAIIERQQERDMASMKKFLQQQRKRVLQSAETRAKRQHRLIENLKKRYKTASSHGGNPTLIGFLVKADAILSTKSTTLIGPVDTSRSQPLVVQAANFDNIAEEDNSIYTSPGGLGRIVSFIDFHFIWQSDRDGLLTPAIGLLIRGGWQIETPPDCWNVNNASVKVSAALRVQQTQNNGMPIVITGSPIQSILDRDFTGGGSYGYVYYDELYPFADKMDLVTPQMQIQAGSPVVFTVTVWADIYAENGGDAEVDMRTGPFQIEVPLGMFVVES